MAQRPADRRRHRAALALANVTRRRLPARWRQQLRTGRVAEPLLEPFGRPVAPAGFRAIPFDLSWANTMNVYARVAATLDDRRAAAHLVDLIEPWRDQIASSFFGMGSLAHALGLSLATIGRDDEAEDAFSQAAAVHEHIGAPVLLAQTRLDWARMLSHRDGDGSRQRARDLADAAHTVAAELGAGAIVQSARELLESLDTQGGRSGLP